jgi:hypothetical protein
VPRPLAPLLLRAGSDHACGACPRYCFAPAEACERGADGTESAGFVGGCCTKPARKSSSALAEVHVRAAVGDDVGTDRPLATNGMGVFGAHP